MFIKRNLAVGAVAIASVFAMSPAASAASGGEGAVKVVNVAVEQTMSAVQDSAISDAEAGDILETVNIERVAQFALANTWKELSDNQKASYMSAFNTYAKAQMREHLSSLSNAQVEVSDVITRSADDAIVVTSVKTDGEPDQKVSWRVINDGEWGIVDIQVQDVWFAIQQREQFQAVLDKNNGNIDALIAELQGGSLG
ncbi:MAG: ABC transporter substrate-binding protein [Pseudomonadota bacterium]|nr:ABC transporter substrate-binding protein [Pseudomonadota bacterium]